MQWFTWLERLVAHICECRTHEAPAEEHANGLQNKTVGEDESVDHAKPRQPGGRMDGMMMPARTGNTAASFLSGFRSNVKVKAARPRTAPESTTSAEGRARFLTAG